MGHKKHKDEADKQIENTSCREEYVLKRFAEH